MSVTPLLQSVHLFSLGLLGGVLLSRNYGRWFKLALTGLTSTGVCMLALDFDRLLTHPLFVLKMLLLSLALGCHLFSARRFSALLWVLIALVGRWIGFY